MVGQTLRSPTVHVRVLGFKYWLSSQFQHPADATLVGYSLSTYIPANLVEDLLDSRVLNLASLSPGFCGHLNQQMGCLSVCLSVSPN